jgi:hypothetical protein
MKISMILKVAAAVIAAAVVATIVFGGRSNPYPKVDISGAKTEREAVQIILTALAEEESEPFWKVEKSMEILDARPNKGPMNVDGDTTGWAEADKSCDEALKELWSAGAYDRIKAMRGIRYSGLFQPAN